MRVVVIVLCVAGCLSDPDPSHDAGPPDAAVPDAYRPDATVCDDGDGDGYLPEGCSDTLPFDCNDGVSAIHPGAFDDCNSAADDDCVGGPLDCAVALVPNTSSAPGTEHRVANGFVQATFDRANNLALTSLRSLRGNGAADELMFTGAAIQERFAGVNEWQEWFSWDVSGTAPAADVMSDGRAAFRVRADWVAANGAGAGAGMTGTTTYTLYPDGRIHIDHDLVATGDGSILTAYLALSRPQLSHADWSNNPGGPYAITGTQNVGFYEDDAMPADWLCAYDEADADVIGWVHDIPNGESRNGPRMSESFLDQPQLALQWDWFTGAAVPAGTYLGNFMVVVDRVPDVGLPCDPVAALADPYLSPAVLDVASPGARVTDQPGDDDADGFNEGGGYYELDAVSGNVVSFTINALGATPAPTSAYRIRNMDFTRDPTVRLNTVVLSHGRDYLFHVDDEDDGWLFLALPLDDDYGISIEVPAS